jgi:hypothetical protein
VIGDLAAWSPSCIDERRNDGTIRGNIDCNRGIRARAGAGADREIYLLGGGRIAGRILVVDRMNEVRNLPIISVKCGIDDDVQLSWVTCIKCRKKLIALNRSAVGELVATPLRYSLRQVLPPCFLSFFTRCF